jgi:plasmid maintenance system killer protein
MIAQIRHRGLRRLHEEGKPSGVPAAYAGKLRRILFALDNSSEPAALDLTDVDLVDYH